MSATRARCPVLFRCGCEGGGSCIIIIPSKSWKETICFCLPCLFLAACTRYSASLTLSLGFSKSIYRFASCNVKLDTTHTQILLMLRLQSCKELARNRHRGPVKAKTGWWKESCVIWMCGKEGSTLGAPGDHSWQNCFPVEISPALQGREVIFGKKKVEGKWWHCQIRNVNSHSQILFERLQCQEAC